MAKVRNFFNHHMNLLEAVLFTERSKYLCLISLMVFPSTESAYSLALLAAWLDGNSEENNHLTVFFFL